MLRFLNLHNIILKKLEDNLQVFCIVNVLFVFGLAYPDKF